MSLNDGGYCCERGATMNEPGAVDAAGIDALAAAVCCSDTTRLAVGAMASSRRSFTEEDEAV